MLSRLGKYQIQAEIGRGGFGQVYRATDGKRAYAIKVLLGKQEASALDKFKRDYTTAGNLRHRNIVRVYEFGEEDGTPFVVMEYLDGENLQQVIKKNLPLSLYQKLRILEQLADGLHCAHRNGVTHRDVKPSNVMVLKDGTVKITDFAIARMLRDSGSPDPSDFLELIVYCAPERIAAKPVKADPLSDIWSYGVVLYELLAGRNPFEGKSIHNAVYRIVTQEPAPLSAEPCSAELQAIAGKLLCKEREFRYQTLEDAQLDLQPILKSLETDEADRLVFEAQEQAAQQKWSEAYDVVREACRLDPKNRSARALYDRVQSEWQKESVRRRFDEFLRRSAEAAQQRRIAEAISLLNEARTIDSKDEKVSIRLQELRVLKQRLDEAAALLMEAGKEFRDKRLTDAFEHATKAVSLDPDNPEAQGLLAEIRTSIRARDAENAAESEMRKARDLVADDPSAHAIGPIPAGQYTIGPYPIHGKLGHGGMGVVYKGYDTGIRRWVAIKVIHLAASADPQQITEACLRFEREAMAAGRLSHPNITAIYHTGEHQGDKFIAMELVKGQSLDQLIRKGGMDLSRVLRILSQVAEGLDYAHSEGVYHRDIKPANILVGDNGVTKIADFGIAKISADPASSITSETLTKTGMAIGSLPYMAPEQINDSRSIDAKADQYSLAVMAYEIFCGRRPFAADTEELMRKIAVEDAPPAHVINPRIPKACSEVLARGLAKRAGDRYDDCRSFVAALSAAWR